MLGNRSLCSGPTYPVDKIGVAKLLGDQTTVKLTGKIVSCVDGNTAYLEEPDRGSAIAVTGLTGCSPGQVISGVTGALSTNCSQRVLSAASFSVCSGATYTIKPLGVPLSQLIAVPGILALTWGRVSASTADGFTLTDGRASVKVRWTDVSPIVGSYITATGTLTLDGTFLARAVQVSSYG